MHKRIRVAVIGTGIGRQHVVGYAELPDLFDVAYICDLNRERAEEAARLVPGTQVVADFAEVLADPTVDIVDICLPPRMHAPFTITALNAGKHVICEKPLAGSMADVRRIQKAAEDANRHVFPVFQYRYGTSYYALHDLKKRGLLGRPYVLSMETHWQRTAAYYAEQPWRGTWAGELGGVLVSHACHIHNLATHLVGRITEVAAFAETRVNPVETEDCAAIAMRSVEGAMITSSVTLGGAGNITRFRACFEHLTVTSSDEPYQVCSAPWRFVATDPGRQAEVDAVVAAAPHIPPRFPGFFTDIHRRLTGQADFYLPDIEDSYHSIELITAFYDSARSGRIVSLPLPDDHPMAEGWINA